MTWLRMTVVCTVLSGMSLIALAAGESAADQKTLNHLQQIGQASLIYAAENRGYFPTTFGQLAGNLKKPEAFLDARSDAKPPVDWDKMTPEQQKEWVNKNCEFDFTAVAGQKSFRIKNSSTVPFVVTREKAGQKKVTLFADGRAQIEGSGEEPKQLPPAPATQP